MSVVAVRIYDEKIEVAADSIMVRGWTQTNKYSKLHFINDMYIGTSGLAEEGSLFRIYCTTRKPEQATEGAIITFFSEFADWKNNRTGSSSLQNEYIFIYSGKVFEIQHFHIQEIKDFTAIGAGMDFALAALHLGHKADEAVAVACALSVYCEEPIDLFTINK